MNDPAEPPMGSNDFVDWVKDLAYVQHQPFTYSAGKMSLDSFASDALVAGLVDIGWASWPSAKRDARRILELWPAMPIPALTVMLDNINLVYSMLSDPEHEEWITIVVALTIRDMQRRS